jgi:prepilin-type N-terminal cleavage/methylation domain-containing protein
MRNRRGFTLVEILVSLVIMLIVSGAIYQMLNSSQRLSRAQAERVSLQTNVRSGALVVPTELRELSTFVGGGDDQNDVLEVVDSTDIRYRAMRGIGFVCQAPTTSEIWVAARGAVSPLIGYSGYRDPKATRDRLYVFIDGDEITTFDSWLPLSITGVDPGTCGGAAAIKLTVSPSTVPALPLRTPVRIFEEMQLKLYVNGGKSWLGARSVYTGEAFQPVLGPLTDAAGLAFQYLDAGGVPTTNLKAIKSIRVTLRGITDQSITKGNGSSGALSNVQDTLVTQVVLRNAFRQ